MSPRPCSHLVTHWADWRSYWNNSRLRSEDGNQIEREEKEKQFWMLLSLCLTENLLSLLSFFFLHSSSVALSLSVFSINCKMVIIVRLDHYVYHFYYIMALPDRSHQHKINLISVLNPCANKITFKPKSHGHGLARCRTVFKWSTAGKRNNVQQSA